MPEFDYDAALAGPDPVKPECPQCRGILRVLGYDESPTGDWRDMVVNADCPRCLEQYVLNTEYVDATMEGDGGEVLRRWVSTRDKVLLQECPFCEEDLRGWDFYSGNRRMASHRTVQAETTYSVSAECDHCCAVVNENYRLVSVELAPEPEDAVEPDIEGGRILDHGEEQGQDDLAGLE